MMSDEIIKEPFKNKYCEECCGYYTLDNGWRVCAFSERTVRKITNCENYIHEKIAKLLKEVKDDD